MDSPRPWLRYVDASDLDNSTITFDGMPVDSPSAEPLGKVDGVIVDASAGRPYYVVVDAGGWFKSKYFLLPIGHVNITNTGNRLVADIAKDRVERFPGFDRGEFEKLSDSELDRMAVTMADICCPSTPATAGASWTARAHYASPSWWRSDYYRAASTTSSVAPAIGSPAATPSYRDTSRQREREQERIAAQGGDDVSPYPGGRAQPGDVLGLETGGEETHIGDTSEDENERRRDAEKTAAKEDKR